MHAHISFQELPEVGLNKKHIVIQGLQAIYLGTILNTQKCWPRESLLLPKTVCPSLCFAYIREKERVFFFAFFVSFLLYLNSFHAIYSGTSFISPYSSQYTLQLPPTLIILSVPINKRSKSRLFSGTFGNFLAENLYKKYKITSAKVVYIQRLSIFYIEE